MINVNKKEILDCLNSNEKELFALADKIRKENVGDEIHLRGLIEFSNVCKRNCFYCGIRRDNKNAQRYRLDEAEIIKTAKIGADLGYKTIVLQSGEDDFFNIKKLSKIIEKIKSFDVAITLSIGEKTKEEYKELKKAGADRFLLRIETTDETLYKKFHPNMDFKNRINCLYNLKELGYETGTGSLVGLPNQTVESLADDILFYKKLDADMVGIGPFIPHSDTPLCGKLNENNFTLALKMMATTRIVMPDINIPATTAMEVINKQGRIIALNSGANVIMPNITSSNYKEKYEIYPGKENLNNKEDDYKKLLEETLIKIGRTISNTKGFRQNKKSV